MAFSAKVPSWHKEKREKQRQKVCKEQNLQGLQANKGYKPEDYSTKGSGTTTADNITYAESNSQ